MNPGKGMTGQLHRKFDLRLRGCCFAHLPLMMQMQNVSANGQRQRRRSGSPPRRLTVHSDEKAAAMPLSLTRNLVCSLAFRNPPHDPVCETCGCGNML